MKDIIKLDIENNILVVRHYYRNGWSALREYKLSDVINSIDPKIDYKDLGEIEYYE